MNENKGKETGGEQVVPGRVTIEETIEAPAAHLVLPKGFVRNLKKSDTTPSVKNTEVSITRNTAALTVTNFTEGATGQKLYIRGDGKTTLKHGTKIFMFAAADLLLATNKMYLFVGIENMNKEILWYQVGV